MFVDSLFLSIALTSSSLISIVIFFFPLFKKTKTSSLTYGSRRLGGDGLTDGDLTLRCGLVKLKSYISFSSGTVTRFFFVSAIESFFLACSNFLLWRKQIFSDSVSAFYIDCDSDNSCDLVSLKPIDSFYSGYLCWSNLL